MELTTVETVPVHPVGSAGAFDDISADMQGVAPVGCVISSLDVDEEVIPRARELVLENYVVAGLEQTRLRPDALFLPDNMQTFSAVMAQQGQPFDYLLFAKLTSGTTEKNCDYQRDYLLTLELVDVQSGDFDKESAKIRKGYHVSHVGKLRNFNPFTKK